MSTPPVYLVTGDDPVLRAQAVHAVVERLLAGDDASLAVEDHTIPDRPKRDDGDGDVDDPGAGAADASGVVATALGAALTPPFGTQRRIVVLREVGALTAGPAEPLVAYLADPMPTTVLVLAGGGGTVPAALTKAVKAAHGEEVKAGGGGTDEVLKAALREHGLTLSADALRAVTDRLGDEAGRVPAIVEVLASTYGDGNRLDASDIEPYLGDEGGVPPYVLTNAIDSGDTPAALSALHRLRTATGPRQPKAWHPMQVTAFLHSHYARLLRLDSPDIRTEADAVAALGGKVKPYPARKQWDQARRLGTPGLRSAIDLLARADLDLRGASAMPEDAVIEVLVARLANLSRRAAHVSGETGHRRVARSSR